MISFLQSTTAQGLSTVIATGLGLFGVILCSLTVYSIYFQSRRGLPPGPPGYPIIGNLMDLTPYPEILYTEWAKKYGDIVYLNVLGKDMIILNTVAAARDVLEGHGSIHGDRPRMRTLELMGWTGATTLMPYNARLRRQRHFITSVLNDNAVRDNLTPLLKKESITFLKNLWKAPNDFPDHIGRFAVGIVMSVAYGLDIESIDQPVMQYVRTAMGRLVQTGTPGSGTMVDFIPIMQYLPSWSTSFMRTAAISRPEVELMWKVPFEMSKAKIGTSKAKSSVITHMITKLGGVEKLNPEDEQDIKATGGALYAGGEDTTTVSLLTFFLCATRNQEAFRRSQKEIDEVVGTERLPSYEDRASLPFTEAVQKEVWRWSSPPNLGIPHASMKDDTYKGYYIPKGSMIVANLYGMTRACVDPEEFRPERYMKGFGTEPQPDPKSIIFGLCPGRHLADRAIWLAITQITALFDISPKGDVLPPADFKPGFTRHPKPFECKIVLRQDRAHLLQ